MFKLSLTLSLALTLAQQAFAATPSRYAYMEATYASGFYEPTRHAGLAMNYDSSGNPRSLTLSADGRKLTAWVWQTKLTRCGDRITARLNVPNERTVTNIELTDFSHVRCRLYVKHHWHATIDTTEADGSSSHLQLEGDPQE